MQVDFLSQLADLLSGGEPFALTTVVEAIGSTPRKAGVKMLVDSRGRAVGTIGGGCPEAEANEEAQRTAGDGVGRLCSVNMGHSADDLAACPSGEVQICGGQMLVLTEPLSRSSANGSLVARVLQRVNDGDIPQAWVVTWSALAQSEALVPGKCSAVVPVTDIVRYACWSDGQLEGSAGKFVPSWCANLADMVADAVGTQRSVLRSVQIENRREYCYIEPFEKPLQMVIAGAGHVSRPLCQMAATCGYRVTVIDDRSEFANADYFPDAVRIECVPFAEFFEHLQVDERMAIVLVTRGHHFDEVCLRALGGRYPGYLGMIGSRRRTAMLRQRLLDDGFTAEWLDTVHAPIGLDIGAQTPAEIAVAIMAQIIAERQKHSGESLS